MFVEIEDHKDLYRDIDSKGLMSTSVQYEEYKKRLKGQTRINNVIEDVQILKEDMKEIKQLLMDIKNGS
jgi:protein subunit release factor A